MSRCTKALDPFIRENESNKKHANDPLPRSAANPNGESSVDRDSRRLCPRAVPTEKKLNTFYRSTRGKWERREWRGGKKQVIQGGTRLEKWKGKGGERTRDCNLINPRLEVARRSGVRSTGSDRLETLARQAYETVEEGDARIADRCDRIQHSQRLGSDEFSRAPTRFRYGSASLIAIERTRPHRTEVCKLWNMRGRGRGGWVCLGPRARAGRRSRPAVITMQTRMVGLFDEFQTRCNADGRKHRLRVRSLYRIGFHLSRCGVIGLRDAFENFLSLLWIIK